MADILLDGGTQTEIDHYYHGLYRPSTLNPDAFEGRRLLSCYRFAGALAVFHCIAPCAINTGKVVGAIETLMDISALKRAQQEVQQFNVGWKPRWPGALPSWRRPTKTCARQHNSWCRRKNSPRWVAWWPGLRMNSTPVGIVLTAVTTLQHQAQAFQAELASGSAVRQANLNAYIAASLHACELIERSAVRTDELIRNFKGIGGGPNPSPSTQV